MILTQKFQLKNVFSIANKTLMETQFLEDVLKIAQSDLLATSAQTPPDYAISNVLRGNSQTLPWGNAFKFAQTILLATTSPGSVFQYALRNIILLLTPSRTFVFHYAPQTTTLITIRGHVFSQLIALETPLEIHSTGNVWSQTSAQLTTMST